MLDPITDCREIRPGDLLCEDCKADDSVIVGYMLVLGVDAYTSNSCMIHASWWLADSKTNELLFRGFNDTMSCRLNDGFQLSRISRCDGS